MDNTKTWDVIVVRDVMVPMRDGVHLATDLYVPAENRRPLEQKLPAVLQRTPYNKSGFEGMASFFAKHGYLSAVQDCRGRDKSEGESAHKNEAKDGYDAVEWLAKEPSCNGKVGTYGCSYMAWVQFQTATQNPPSLVTMIPYQAFTSMYHEGVRRGGALKFQGLQWMLQQAISSKEAKQNPVIAQAVQTMSQNFLQWAYRVPWRRGQTPLSAAPQYEDWTFRNNFENVDYSDFWRNPCFATDDYLESFPNIPMLWVTGWYDWFYRATMINNYQKMVKINRKNQYLVVGPWKHNSFDSTIGDVNFGSGGGNIKSYDDYLNMELQWFDRWMKDDLSVDVGKAVKVFVMGGGDGKRHENGHLNHGGTWRSYDTWPPEGVQTKEFYLNQDGTLSQEKPDQESSSTTYTYDPRNPVSSNHGGLSPEIGALVPGPRDQIELATLPGMGVPGMPIASRPDVLVFQTPPLSEDVKIIGNVKAVLWISSDAPDTDFFVKLIDVYPSSPDYPTGYAFPVSEGILRARYRDSWEFPTLMESGKLYQIEIQVEPAANLFKANHRIRLDIYSSNFPNLDINRNTGDSNSSEWRIAENTVYHEAEHASYIVLPIYP